MLFFGGAEKQIQKQKNNPLIYLIVWFFSKTLLLLRSKVLTNNYQLKSATPSIAFCYLNNESV